MVSGGAILNQASLNADFMALQSELEKEAERLEKCSNIKGTKEKAANEMESVTPSIVTMPNQEELKALLEANDLLKAKVFKQ